MQRCRVFSLKKDPKSQCEYFWKVICGIPCVFFGSRKIKTKIPEADDLPINVRPKSSPSTRSPVGHPVCSCSSIFFRTRPFYETVESTWLKQLSVKRIESKILGQKLHLHRQLNNLGFKFELQFNSSRTEAAKKPRGRAYFMRFGGSSEAKHTLGSSFLFFDLPPELFPVFPLKKFMGILPGLHSISFTCISNMRNFLEHGIFSIVSSQIKTPRIFLLWSVDVDRCHFLWCVTFSQGETDEKAAATGAEHTKSAEDSDWWEPPSIKGWEKIC